jgi:hypothetical protein
VCLKFVLTSLKIVAWFLMAMCSYSLGNVFVQLVAILKGERRGKFVQPLMLATP